ADDSGHGTSVASAVASRDGTYTGVAPGASLIVLKVLDGQGNGSFANVEKALQWVAANAAAYHIASVNLSFTDRGDYATPQSLYGIGDELAARAAKGVIVVSAAGNNSFSDGGRPGVAYPAADPDVLAVGAVWDADVGGPYTWKSGAEDFSTGPDRIASFSQRD